MKAWNQCALGDKSGYTSASLGAQRKTAGGQNEMAEFCHVKSFLHKYSVGIAVLPSAASGTSAGFGFAVSNQPQAA